MSSGNPTNRVAGTDGSDHSFRAKKMTRYDVMHRAKQQLTKVFACQCVYAVGLTAFALSHLNSAVPYTTHDPVWELAFALIAVLLLPLSYDAKRKSGASMRLLPFGIALNLLMGAVALGVGVLRQIVTPYASLDTRYHAYAWQCAVALHAFGVLSNMLASYFGFQLYKAVTVKSSRSRD